LFELDLMLISVNLRDTIYGKRTNKEQREKDLKATVKKDCFNIYFGIRKEDLRVTSPLWNKFKSTRIEMRTLLLQSIAPKLK
jgi:hypothetical protein